ncbi:sugar ABC transporter permease [Dactylosporangium sp. AC04546]|uniref:carbohydrate ABC transporter permease n=1 Tax=Dactylosporangium sp. AC04546 TaxID=2862460 RepID=UPI001EE14EAB|nr:sugar ABC transporter permease [Dactylosporangium sp. AC04546]WVK87319.1 sugar ABC transporter permease [Dactylosporangium sp. AC04546]
MNADMLKVGTALLYMGAFILAVGLVVHRLDAILGRGRRARPWYVAVFLGPTLLLLCVGLAYPMLRTLYLSFFDATGESFVGGANYAWIFANDDTLLMLRNTLLWVVCVPLASTVIGLVYAVLVDNARRERIATALIVMPMAISFVGATIIWKFVYAYRDAGQEQIGLLNEVLVALGAKPRQFLTDAPGNTFYMIVMLVWIQAGFAAVVLSAAIKNLPAEVAEAARLDGADPRQMFWWVTMPSIRPTVLLVAMTITVATLKVFDIVRTSTGGQFESSVLALEVYHQSFRAYDSGRGAALAVLLFVLVVPIAAVQLRRLRRRA